MQPHNKSLTYYVSRGYALALGERLDSGLKLDLDLSSFDTGIIIIDDILDKSTTRNGKPVLHEEKGLEFALLEGLRHLSNVQTQFGQRRTNEGWKFNYLGLRELNSLFQDVIQGEIIDKNVKTLNDYFSMITLFTGNHIAKGVNVGYYLTAEHPPKGLYKACQSAGRIRQIVDDFEDYYDEHHEPFGDFLQGKNRLPELLFKGDKDKAKRLILNKEYERARNYILNKEVREKLHSFCEKEFANIERYDVRAKEFVVNYDKIVE